MPGFGRGDEDDFRPENYSKTNVGSAGSAIPTPAGCILASVYELGASAAASKAAMVGSMSWV